MSATHKRVVVDGVVIRSTKGDPLPEHRSGHNGKLYPLEIDGVHRGYLVHRHGSIQRWSDSGGWRLLALCPELDRDDQPGPYLVRVGMTMHDMERVLKQAAHYAAEGAMPTIDEVPAWIENAQAIRRRNAEIEAERIAERARQREARARHMEERNAMIAAEDAHIREAYAELLASQAVTNFQREGLVLAAKRLGITL